VRLEGHAIEARVYAESPARGFLPATGDVLVWRAAEGVRTDGAVESGSVVSADYDPMIAKVIAHGADRAEALARLDAALADTAVLGVDTNIAFLRALLADPAVVAGDMDTGLIDRLPPFVAPEPSPSALRAAAAVGDGRARAMKAGRDSKVGALWLAESGWRSGSEPVVRTVAVETEDRSLVLVGAPEPGPVVSAGRNGWSAVSIGRALDSGVIVAHDRDGWTWVHADGASHRLRALTRREAMERRLAERERDAGAADPQLRAPMPGAVVAVHVADGAAVRTGDRIVTIEAMKMEHPVTAPHDGVVTLDVAVGEQVRREQPLAHVVAQTTAAHEPAAAAASDPDS
jgi:acetyl-CoA/propionyl-CoA carboxylase biotin carboxyl carrier protein